MYRRDKINNFLKRQITKIAFKYNFLDFYHVYFKLTRKVHAVLTFSTILIVFSSFSVSIYLPIAFTIVTFSKHLVRTVNFQR